MTRLLLIAALAAVSAMGAAAQKSQTAGWPEYGGTAGGQRYSTAKQIDAGNVGKLEMAWTFHTHVFDQQGKANHAASFEATPVLWNGTLYFDTPFDRVFAVDAATGTLQWSFDPKVDRNGPLYIVTSRGVTLWHSKHPLPGACGSDTVMVATLDRRLIARDAKTGAACPKFGDQGTVDLAKGVLLDDPALYFFTSPAVVVGDMVVLGSSVADNQKLFAGSGAVRGFDAVTGQQRWSWEPVRWTDNQHPKQSGAGNAWAPLSADPEHDLVFVPTGSASLDYYGGDRVGDNRDADSIVALRGSTGEKVWAFQLVHHDLWDYDTASQPLLFNFRGHIPAVAVTNKTGMIYVFNRLDGTPLYPIEERPVPASTLAGEVTWPTQPFSTLPSLVPQRYAAAELAFSNEADRKYCSQRLSALKYEGLFTPPSVGGTLVFPAAISGPNWGSSALDPATGVLYTRVTLLPYALQMVPRLPKYLESIDKVWKRWAPTALGGEPPPNSPQSSQYQPPDMGLAPVDGSAMNGAPYSMLLHALVGPDGTPCGPGPYGQIVATDLNSGRRLWSVSHGMMRKGLQGSPGVGGAIVTAGGLLFAASTNDPYLRAYNAKDGSELWKASLPATANATPMTYEAEGRQYVVIAVGGHKFETGDESDSVVAFALPKPAQQAGPGRRSGTPTSR